MSAQHSCPPPPARASGLVQLWRGAPGVRCAKGQKRPKAGSSHAEGRYQLGTRPSSCRQPSLLQLLLRRLWRSNKFPQGRGRAGGVFPPTAHRLPAWFVQPVV